MNSGALVGTVPMYNVEICESLTSCHSADNGRLMNVTAPPHIRGFIGGMSGLMIAAGTFAGMSLARRYLRLQMKEFHSQLGWLCLRLCEVRPIPVALPISNANPTRRHPAHWPLYIPSRVTSLAHS